MRAPSARSSSGVRRGSFAISRRYALSVPASSPRFDGTRESLLLLMALGVRAYEISWRGFHERSRQSLFPIVDAARHFLLDIRHELVDFPLHRFDLATHVQNDLDAGKVDAQISGK